MIFFMRIAQNQHFHVTLFIFRPKFLHISQLFSTFALDHQHKTSEEGWCDIWVNK